MKRLLIILIVLTSACIEKKVCFDGNCVNVEVVKNPEEMAMGLMFREELPEGRGMLFVFPDEGRHPFWMKNMNFPIDMIWINKDEVVVHIEYSMPPCKTDNCPSYVPTEKALYVLEVNANYTLKNNITVGSMVKELPTVLAN